MKRLSRALPLLACAALLAACSSSPAHKTAPPTTTKKARPQVTTPKVTTSPTSTPQVASVPSAFYTNVPAGQPGFGLEIQGGPPGSSKIGGVALYTYQDGKQLAAFSFSGSASMSAPFTVATKGSAGSSKATMTFTQDPEVAITLKSCASLFSALGLRFSPASCVFTYKFAPSSPGSTASSPSNLPLGPSDLSNLASAYLTAKGWTSIATPSQISTPPDATYAGYDPGTGLDWAFASYSYTGPMPMPNQMAIGMQDGGSDGIFYRVANETNSENGGWTMVEPGAVPMCFSLTVLPSSLISLWGVTSPQSCQR